MARKRVNAAGDSSGDTEQPQGECAAQSREQAEADGVSCQDPGNANSECDSPSRR